MAKYDGARGRQSAGGVVVNELKSGAPGPSCDAFNCDSQVISDIPITYATRRGNRVRNFEFAHPLRAQEYGSVKHGQQILRRSEHVCGPVRASAAAGLQLPAPAFQVTTAGKICLHDALDLPSPTTSAVISRLWTASMSRFARMTSVRLRLRGAYRAMMGAKPPRSEAHRQRSSALVR